MSSNIKGDVKVSQKRKGAARKTSGEVLVVQCPGDFPSLSDQNHSPSNPQRKKEKIKGKCLDWSLTAREIHSFGATGFQGKQKRNFENEQYEKLTGRKKKHHKVPVKIVRGIKKKQAARERRDLELARESGLIIPRSSKVEQKPKRKKCIHGPAPSIGFLQNGVYRAKKP